MDKELIALYLATLLSCKTKDSRIMHESFEEMIEYYQLFLNYLDEKYPDI